MVDSQTRSAVTRMLNQTGGGTPEAADAIGREAGRGVRQICSEITPEGRAVIVLTGAAATVVYGVLHWEELEPKVQDAIRKAKIPVTVPIDKVRVPGKLTLSLGLEEIESRYRVNMGPGRLDLQLKHDLDLGSSQISGGWSGRAGSGQLNTRILHDTRTNNTRFTGSYRGEALGGRYETGVRYNTRNGDGAVFFEYKLSW